jgi:hypothetical protein
MTFDAEIVVRASGQVTVETLYYDGHEPPAWDEQDARAVLTLMLLAVDRAANGAADMARSVALRGLSWIVTPFDSGAAVAIEITAGSVIAGPFEIPDRMLTTLIARAIEQDAAGRPS